MDLKYHTNLIILLCIIQMVYFLLRLELMGCCLFPLLSQVIWPMCLAGFWHSLQQPTHQRQFLLLLAILFFSVVALSKTREKDGSLWTEADSSPIATILFYRSFFWHPISGELSYQHPLKLPDSTISCYPGW